MVEMFYLNKLAVLIIFDNFIACNKIRSFKPYLIPGKQSEIFFDRNFHKIFFFDIEFSRKTHLSRPQLRIFFIVFDIAKFRLALRIIHLFPWSTNSVRTSSDNLSSKIRASFMFASIFIVYFDILFINTQIIERFYRNYQLML